MADSQKAGCISCGSLCGGKGLATLKEGAWTSNPLVWVIEFERV